MNKLKSFYEKYKHGVPLLVYMAIYLVWFGWLEKKNTKNYWVIHLSIDDYIPFCEIFVIPYLLWFAYVAAVVIWLFLKDKQEYYKACGFLFTGMTLFLIISTLWPNGHNLRPAVMPRDNVFTSLIALLWKTDTPTNLWPSIHVFNSMGAHFAVMHSQKLAASKWGGAHPDLLRYPGGFHHPFHHAHQAALDVRCADRSGAGRRHVFSCLQERMAVCRKNAEQKKENTSGRLTRGVFFS